MSGISFRYRKTGRCVDAGFILFNGKEISNATRHWMVGDDVSVCFNKQNEISAAVREHAPWQMEIITNDGFISIPCRVVSRSHSVVWRQVGEFQHLQDCNVALEAVSGEWEDVLLWIVRGVKPEWVPERC